MRKIFSLLAALTLSAGLWAIDNVAYIDANGQPQTANGVIEITNATEAVTWAAGWYVVTGTDVQLAKGAVCNGAVNLILADGAKLTATGAERIAGIYVSGDDNSLTIYGQTAQSGQLIATGGKYGGAGIGGGFMSNGSNITINGGIVTATGNTEAAGIGGGGYAPGSNITINGGIITANGGGSAAGIGGGAGGSGSNITINSGIVTATGGYYAAGIGGGFMSNGSNITINGGTVTANGGEDAAGIGSGNNGGDYTSNIFVATDLVVKADGNNPPTTVIAATRTATTDIASDLAGKRYATVETPAGPVEGDQFEDAGLKFEITAVGEANTVKVIKNNYSGTTYDIPATVTYNDVDFAVTEIGEDAFAYCSSLESITLPTGLTTIGESAFNSCEKLISITLPESVTTIDVAAFYECTSLESINIPAGVTTIESDVFNNCKKLQSIIIPADVTTIGSIAFAGSGLQTITIPAGVISLGMGAFAECAGLTSVTFEGTACQDAIGEMAFYGVGVLTPAALTLPDNWTGILPDEEGNWYEGKFELVSGPATALPTLFGDGVKGNKFLHNGHLIIRKGEKHFNALGQEL